ncbi:MAG: alpha/beta hydrolase [Microthrixaceae bacterium]|nr:alpha/beta hydrolase [Microthrixaceae bacterium]
MTDIADQAGAAGVAQSGPGAPAQRSHDRSSTSGRPPRSTEVLARSSRARLRLVNAGARRLATPRNDTDPLEIRNTIDRLARLQPRPHGVVTRSAIVAGVPGEWVVAKKATSPLTLLYFHGGGYIAGGPHTHRALVGALVRRFGGRAFVPDYRLAPEHRYPAALDDARSVYDRLILDVGPDSLVVGGDSAGGGLATALMADRRDAGAPMPERLALISPWVDLTGPIPEAIESRSSTDVVMRADQIRAAALTYAGERVAEPGASPLWGDLSDLPPTMIQVGSAELLGVEGELLADRLLAVGVAVRLEVWQHMAHVFQAVPVLREHRPALDRLAGFLLTPTG